MDALPVLLQSCCLSAQANGDNGPLIEGIQNATLLLLVVPWALVGGFIYWVWSKHSKRGG